MSGQKRANDLPEQYLDTSGGRGLNWFVGGSQAVGMLDADHAPARQGTGIDDRSWPSCPNLLARAGRQVHPTMSAAVGIRGRIEWPGDGQRFR